MQNAVLYPSHVLFPKLYYRFQYKLLGDLYRVSPKNVYTVWMLITLI
jgi:hypothetical protein